jgi:hypothetical protein
MVSGKFAVHPMSSCTLSIHSGESVFSLLIRYCRWTSTDIQSLVGNVVLHQKTTFRDLPIGVFTYESHTQSRFQLRQALLTEHSAAMYFASPVPAPMREDELGYCTNRSSLLDRVSLATTWSHLRFCPICTEQEFRSYRYSWWHRDHQLPLSVICMQHSCMLASTSLEFRALVLPHELAVPGYAGCTHSEPSWREFFAICRLEQFLAMSTSYDALENHVYQPLRVCLRNLGEQHEAEEQILSMVKAVLIALRHAGQTEPSGDWDHLRLRILALIRNGVAYCDPVAAVLTAIACRRLYRLPV